MAIFHLAHKFLSRGGKHKKAKHAPSSSLATAAYNSGQKLEDKDGSSDYSDYTRKSGVLFDEILLPTGTPPWANQRGELWRRLEAREDKSTRRADAVLAHNFNIALPHELTLEQNIFLTRDFVREQFTRKGYAADWAIHSADPRGDNRNIHLHILVPLRKITGESFGKKDRYDKSQLRQQVQTWRKSWAQLTNRHLKRYGHKATIDERSLKAQGVKRLPTRHRGPQPKTMRVQLDALRKKQPPLPTAPIVRTTKQVSADGTLTISRTITGSALNKIGRTTQDAVPAADNPTIGKANNSGSNIKFSPAIKNQSRKGWPPEALAAWASWGSKNPALFFRIWSELAPEGFNFGGRPTL